VTVGGLSTADYEFVLPPDRIAQFPSETRDESRLLVVDRATGSFAHRRFRDLVELIPAGDAIVLNTSRVIKARLIGTRDNGARAEFLLLTPQRGGAWEALVHPGGKLKPGRRVQIAPDVAAVIEAVTPRRTRVVRFETPLTVEQVMEQHGHVPLPPYINRADVHDDAARYQTVYAREPGSVAAPTAGLHFTQAMLDALVAKGVRRAEVSLHVGAGTFKPVEGDDPAQHVMHHEQYALSPAAAEVLNATRDAGGHIWAVGTTSLRVLETVVNARGNFAAQGGSTSIFIRPPHVARGADRLITNFHLPRSTLLMLVAAFAGYDLARQAYDVAIAGQYRFYSYGDAMCIV
jgi:S-adenosylmethionine:tRNA ribosyltransferase-isomerase